MPGERPYVKYDSSGGDTIHVAYTNAHPTSSGREHLLRARTHRKIERVGGEQIGSLDDPISPAEGNLVYDGAEQAGCTTWRPTRRATRDRVRELPVGGRPPLPLRALDRLAWDVHQITPAGGFREDGGSPYYSGGLTLDHEDPSRVYLSRQVGAGAWQVETRTTARRRRELELAGDHSAGKNVRPVSPSGMAATGGDMSVIWMNGGYQSYVSYDTAIQALMPAATNSPPVATPSPRSGAATRRSRWPSRPRARATRTGRSRATGGTSATARAAPTRAVAYLHIGRALLPRLTVTDDEGASSTLVEEILVDLPRRRPCTRAAPAATTVHGAIAPANQATDWSVEYGPTEEYGRSPPPSRSRRLRASSGERDLPGLQAGRLYHYRLVADNATGSGSGEDRVLVAGGTLVPMPTARRCSQPRAS